MTNVTVAPLIDAVTNADHARAAALLDAGHDVHETGAGAWPALNFAAGRGDLEMVRLLVSRGADLFRTGIDGRTAYKIASAASHLEVMRYLAACEERAGGDRDRVSSRAWELRPYCKGYRLGEVRRYRLWPEPATATGETHAQSDGDPDAMVVFVHHDYSVTRSIWHGEDVLLDGGADEWRQFCRSTLDFTGGADLT